jgi:hypothetical protein
MHYWPLETVQAMENNPIRADLIRAGLMHDGSASEGNFTGDPFRRRRVLTTDPSIQEWLVDGGWCPLHPDRGARHTGMHAHRGVIHPDEYVNADALRSAAEEKLGYTLEDVRAVYGGRSGGPLPKALLPVRNAIDRELLGVDNMEWLALALGVPELTEALRRGRKRALR